MSASRRGLGSHAFTSDSPSILDSVAPVPPSDDRSASASPGTGRQRQDVVRIDSDAVQLARNLVHFLMVSGQTTATLSQVLRDAVLAYVETQKHQLNGGKDFPAGPHELRRGRRPTFGSVKRSE